MRRRDRVDRLLQIRQAKLEVTRTELLSIAGQITTDIETARREHRQYDTQISALRSELQVASEITIPALVAANKLLHERWEAETAIAVRHQVMATTGPQMRDEI